MFLRDKNSGNLVEVLGVKDLFDPFLDKIVGRFNVGEDLPEATTFNKVDLIFPSSEPLPRCWVDPHYRDDELER